MPGLVRAQRCGPPLPTGGAGRGRGLPGIRARRDVKSPFGEAKRSAQIFSWKGTKINLRAGCVGDKRVRSLAFQRLLSGSFGSKMCIGKS